MKILYSADWHLKLGQKNVPRDWQVSRYKMLFNKLYALERKTDIHIIGGDIFDKVPKPEELSLFFEFINKCGFPTFIYDGNHEAGRKGKTFLTYFKEASSNINSNVHVVDGIETHSFFDDVSIDFIPYTNLKTFNPNDFKSKILCTHVRGSIPPHVLPEIDLDKLKRWDVVLAGDLHSYENSQRNILYPGSPLGITFHRNKIKNGVIIFDTDSMTHEFIDLGLPQLIRKTVDNEKEIIKDNYDHVIYELTGSVLDLSNVSSPLLDKKIVTSSNSAKLELNNMTMKEELAKYLKEIVMLDTLDVEKVVEVFNDNYKEFEME